jgi:hypothetical protein
MEKIYQCEICSFEIFSPTEIYGCPQCAITLSRVQRFWGQLKEPYSVAQHCLSLIDYFENVEHKKWWLAHEIYEGLTGMDIPSPIKHSPAYVPYKEAEDKALDTFARLYGLTPPVPKDVKKADKDVMVMEAEALMPYNSEINWRANGNKPIGKLYKLGASEDEIRRDFINTWQELFGRL